MSECQEHAERLIHKHQGRAICSMADARRLVSEAGMEPGSPQVVDNIAYVLYRHARAERIGGITPLAV